VFASDCILSPTNSGLPLWWWVGPAYRDRNDHQRPGPSYVSDTVLFTQCHLFAICVIFKWLNVMFIFRPPLFMYAYSGQQRCVKDVFSISTLKEKAPIPRKEPSRTHIHIQSHSQPFLLTYPGLIKAYDFLSFLFNTEVFYIPLFYFSHIVFSFALLFCRRNLYRKMVFLSEKCLLKEIDLNDF